MAGWFLFAAFFGLGPLVGGITWGVASLLGAARADADRAGWLGALASVLLAATVYVVIGVVRAKRARAVSVSVLEVLMRDARVIRIFEDKLRGYLFVIDENESLFFNDESAWFADGDDDDDERDLAPAGVRFVIAMASGHGTRVLQREDLGTLRRIPNADAATVDAVDAAASRQVAFGDVFLLPTPPSLVASWPASKPAAPSA